MHLAVKTLFMLAVGLGFCRGAAAQEAFPKGGVWSLAGAMPEPRQEAGVAALGDAIYIVSGYGSDQVPSVLVQVYDPGANKWKQAAPIPQAMHHHGVAAVDGKIYVVGGFTGVFAKRNPIASVWRYDPAADRWEQRAPLPAPRGALAVAVLDGKIYALGGERFSAAKPGAYEPVSDAAV
jgi:N-acetylneuraminic acid mutarotase